MTYADYVRLQTDYCREAEAEALAWHKANGKPTLEQLAAYSAGFREGWRDALKVARLHGYLNPKLEQKVKP